MPSAEKTDNTFRIRPSARILQTIGKDLVKDKLAAIVELVKNSYDADSPTSEIEFEYTEKQKTFTVRLIDFGEGMSFETVVNKWLVPATPDKLKRRKSAKGRPLQGRKGIGRFAAAALGDAIFLTSRYQGEEVSLLLDMSEFSDDKYLEDIPILIDRAPTDGESGTTVEILTRNINKDVVTKEWGERLREKLELELSKLLPPGESTENSDSIKKSEESFNIHLRYKGVPSIEDGKVKIKPINIVDLFDYRIKGNIDRDGEASFEFYNQNIPSLPAEKINKKVKLSLEESQSFPGEVNFDIRVFDRDKEQLEELVKRGLTHPFTGKTVTPAKAKEILDQYYGVSLFRGSFRVRPYGDKDYDWLERDKKRVNNPSYRVGHNQIIGFVSIQPEELSGLEEKSARDGLVENSQYSGLKHILNDVMTSLEDRRFTYRERTLLGRTKPQTIDDKIEDLFNFDGVSRRLEKEISKLDFDTDKKDTIFKIVDSEIKKEQKKKSESYKKVKETLAIYQGQASLGKITHILLHEGRKHLKVFNEVPPRIVRWIKGINNSSSDEVIEKINDRSQMLVSSAKSFSLLFKRIEPLALSKMPARKYLDAKHEIGKCFSIFETEFEAKDISFSVEIEENTKIYSTTFDIATIFTNLIENSIYWLSYTDTRKEINLSVWSEKDEEVEFIFSDNGPGFQGSNTSLMFEPGYTTKQDDTASGLGLALVGEAVSRLGGKIRSVELDTGAGFIIKFKKEVVSNGSN